MRRRLAVLCCLLLVAPLSAQTQNYAPPPAIKISDEALKPIKEKTAQLGQAIAELRKDGENHILLPDVEVFHRAAEMIMQLGEFYQKDSPAWTEKVLDRGVERARQLAKGESPWAKASGQTVVRGYRSQIDGTVQPMAVTYPRGYGDDPKRTWRVDVVLHGRGATLTEVSFLYANGNKKVPPADQDWVQLDVFGRGNNAYRWAGEKDVFEAIDALEPLDHHGGREGLLDMNRVVLRGFSMGGAGTWHLGLHYPDRWCVIGPGAGFTTTHGYTRLPELPPYQEACLRIYDAVDYAENAFNVPIVAYSGSKDPQKAAADNIEKRLKALGLEDRMTHLIAPGLEHKFPPEWFQKANALYSKFAAAARPEPPKKIRFVTYTTKYPGSAWISITAMGKHYQKAIVDAERVAGGYRVKTENVRTVHIRHDDYKDQKIVIDGQELTTTPISMSIIVTSESAIYLRLDAGRWRVDRTTEYKSKTTPSRAPSSASAAPPNRGTRRLRNSLTPGWSASATSGRNTGAVRFRLRMTRMSPTTI
jgi:pimeloyl-ACP methyl ester carboxylesterase